MEPDNNPPDGPQTEERPASFFGVDRHRMKIVGDIISPIEVEWEAQSDPDKVLNP